MDDQLPVLIVGGGIAGLALAGALEALDLPVLVLERRHELATVGAGISLWPNALAALDAMGVGAEVRAAGGAVTAGGIRRPDGRWLRRVDPGFLNQVLGEPMICLQRGDLLEILAGRLRHAALRLGADVAAVTSGPGEVAVLLADGSKVEGTALVGADGVGSMVARHLHSHLTLRYSGYTAWRGVAAMGIGDFEPSETWGPGGEFGLVPLGQDRIYWFATENAEEGAQRSGGELTYLRRRFGSWHSPIPEVLAATSPGDVLRHDIYDRTIPRRWGAGRVTLIGDAAHPMRPHLGQGGCQALEDAVCLADALAEHQDPLRAFAAYEAARRRRTKAVVTRSANVGRLIQLRGPLARPLQGLAAAVPLRFIAGPLAMVGAYTAFQRARRPTARKRKWPS